MSFWIWLKSQMRPNKAMWGYGLLLILLFAGLGKAADIVIQGAKKITHDYRIPAILSGLVLGFFTSAPEFFIGIHSTLQRIGEVSFGNLLGGILILFTLICPLDIILNRGLGLKRQFQRRDIVFTIAYLLLPVLFAWDGVIVAWEGYAMFGGYVFLVYLMYYDEIREKRVAWRRMSGGGMTILSIAFGLLAVLVFSHFIISVTKIIVSVYHFPLVLVGIILFSFGTNLPELIVTLKSWKGKSKDLAVGNIIGSAITNVLILGVITAFRPIAFTLSGDLHLLLFFFSIACILFMIFALSGMRLTIREAMILLGVYIIFLATEIFTKVNV